MENRKLNVLLIGGGGREYALAWKISQSPLLNKLFSISGSDAIGRFAELSKIDWKNFQNVLNFCKLETIDIVVIGPEDPIVGGLSDFLRENEILVFGPSKDGSQIESSKEFTKRICKEKNILTADYEMFEDLENLKNYLKERKKFPLVLKYDGLAAGKGVKVAENIEDAISFAEELNKNFREDFKVVVEEFLEGREISFFGITDGKVIKKFGVAQDHKRAFDNDKGENTGGMGAISGDFLINQELEEKIMFTIIQPTLEYLKKNSIQYIGIIFAGLMIDRDNNPYLLEYNARFGDPETEAMMLRLETDLLEILYNTAIQNLENTKINFSKKSSICVVLASNGYPTQYKKDIFISNNLSIDTEDCKIFHHGTKFKNDNWHSNGGRVLSVNTIGENIKEIRRKAYEVLKEINWTEGFYRSDIGAKFQ